MNGVKICLIAAEIVAILGAVAMVFAPQELEISVKAGFTLMFVISAVMLQSLQQDIKWDMYKE